MGVCEWTGRGDNILNESVSDLGEGNQAYEKEALVRLRKLIHKKDVQRIIALIEDKTSWKSQLGPRHLPWVAAPWHIGSVALVFLCDHFQDPCNRRNPNQKDYIQESQLVQRVLQLVKNSMMPDFKGASLWLLLELSFPKKDRYVLDLLDYPSHVKLLFEMMEDPCEEVRITASSIARNIVLNYPQAFESLRPYLQTYVNMIPNWTCLDQCKLHLLNITDLIVFNEETYHDNFNYLLDLGLLQKVNMISFKQFNNQQNSHFGKEWTEVKHIIGGLNLHQIRRDKNILLKKGQRQEAKKIQIEVQRKSSKQNSPTLYVDSQSSYLESETVNLEIGESASIILKVIESVADVNQVENVPNRSKNRRIKLKTTPEDNIAPNPQDMDRMQDEL